MVDGTDQGEREHRAVGSGGEPAQPLLGGQVGGHRALHRALDATGFDRVRAEPVDAASRFGRDAEDAADLLLGSGRHLLTLLDPEHPDAAAPRVRAAFTTALAPHQGPDGVRLRTAAHLVTAVRR
ncbi:hypothetical protein AB0O31_02375 [Kitasatospora cineracea]|uniref:hypothetical protein n=1 Tax=Kitasatospora cineracea TaxID=88074 RepID=UPI00341D5C0D